MKPVTSFLSKPRTWLFIGTVALMAILSLAQGGWVSSTQAATTVQPASETEPSVSAIWLQTVNAPAGAWTSVQWQDNVGKWHNVESWVEPLVIWSYWDAMPHWVEAADFGTGPFRWVVYTNSKMDTVWGMSPTFYFPTSANGWHWSVVTAGSK